MSYPLPIHIKESITELRAIQRKGSELIAKRMLVLIEIKKHEKEGISKRELSVLTGINHNSIIKWRKMYLAEGLESLLSHGRVGGFKKSVISAEEHQQIEQLLKDPNNGIRGYKELLDWVRTKLSKDIKYITLVKYAQRHFGTKIKVARKSHINKDKEAVEAFKKTSIGNVSS